MEASTTMKDFALVFLIPITDVKSAHVFPMRDRPGSTMIVKSFPSEENMADPRSAIDGMLEFLRWW